ncbi:hypothetical protein SAMN05216244_1114 [Sediminibacillus halophilus]|uniref:Nucleotidyltransferase family protein n=2 Tax=Sediminibacillus halophilus TaxID=482461 RepID=A0A1G9NQZ3_9BACI|nr:hypothetical protein SAMN05216244_1114 [Sediminibacillus halophilus]
MKTETDIIQLIEEDSWMMDIIHATAKLQLPDWWVCAGFVRAKIWDTMHQFSKRTPLSDIDVIFFDPTQPEEEYEKRLEKQLSFILPGIPWSVKNQARMHKVNSLSPYLSSMDAMANFPETATAIGVKTNQYGDIVISAPHGIKDVLNLEVKPSPRFLSDKELLKIFEQRMKRKEWKRNWHNLTIYKGDV